MVYDTVICVSSNHVAIAIKAIKSLHCFLQSRKIFIVTSPQSFALINSRLRSSIAVHLLDEDQLIDNVNLRLIQMIFERRIGSNKKAGWYFQQFLKMAICMHPEVVGHYLIWDSDTVLLKPIDFFDETGRVLINPKTEHHQPYFDLIKRILGIEKQVDFSFISEHFMVNKLHMKELISTLIEKSSEGSTWVELILRSIENSKLPHSGFSEYETYGNFIALRYKSSFFCRRLKTMRTAAKLYGINPNKSDIYSLMKAGYVTASFEDWEPVSRKRMVVNKAMSRFYYWFGHLINRDDNRLGDVREICQ